MEFGTKDDALWKKAIVSKYGGWLVA